MKFDCRSISNASTSGPIEPAKQPAVANKLFDLLVLALGRGRRSDWRMQMSVDLEMGEASGIYHFAIALPQSLRGWEEGEGHRTISGAS